MKSTRQVSRSKINDNHEEFSLGRFYPPRRSLSFSRHLNYLATEFFDGSYCELTESPRSSRIRFICANDKQSMHLTNVLETSACTYNFIVHVPELCGYIPKHSKTPKIISQIKCLNYPYKKSTTREKETSSKADNRQDDKDSSIINQYKSLLLKALDPKSKKLANEFSEVESESSLLELFYKLSRTDQVQDEDENKKNNK